ncbi:MAG TPA: DsbA family protein [Candidatus Moranbacteria bacterium]|nr:DsbA family protein [Candidatus Moranbacteria bacterium]
MTEEQEKKEPEKKMNRDNSINIILAIILAALIIGGSIVYSTSKGGGLFGKAETEEEFDIKVAASIERYIAKQEEEMMKAQEEASKPEKVEGVSADDDAVMGDKNAPVTIIEFSDYECPFCKRSFEQVFPEIKKNYIDTGKARYIFRDMPLSFHDPLATQEAIAAECAKEQGGDEAYYKYHHLIFTNTKSNGNGLQKNDLYRFATEIGLNAGEFKTCLDTERFAEEVKKDMKDGQEYGVQGTPGFFINGWFIKGAYPYETFEEIIEQELAAATK